jgi:BirA family biotin operon repressor/biotin-[acetyl-CoA-carboxylase] ligase
LALALVIAFSLETICPKLTVNIKWPNDLMVDGQKVGGLLLENRSGVLVGGIGLNIGGTPFLDSPRDPKVPPAGYLPASMGPPEKLWLSVAKKILKDYNNSFGLVDPNWTLTLIARAERRLMYLHKPVTVTGLSSTPPIPQTEISGRLTGLDPSGALLLDTDLGSLKIWSGSLSPGS